MIEHLSASSVRLYLECPKRWHGRYVDGLTDPWSIPLIKGRVVDELATRNWQKREQTGSDMDTEESMAYARGRLTAALSAAPNDIDDAGEAWTSIQKLADIHLTHHAPLVNPEATQLRFEVQPKDSYPVIGFLDALDRDGTVFDVKTGKRKMSQADADRDLQATFYAMGLGRPITFKWLRAIDTGKNVSGEVVTSTRSQYAIEWAEGLCADVSNLIDAGSFPAKPGWQCAGCAVGCMANITQSKEVN